MEQQNPVPAPGKGPKRSIRARQLDKVGPGTAAVIGLADPNVAGYQKGLTNNIDGGGRSDIAVIDEQIGAIEIEAGDLPSCPMLQGFERQVPAGCEVGGLASS